MSVPLNMLILEDSASDTELMLHELRRAGYDPIWQRVDTEQEYLRHLDPTLDLILSDYNLPNFDGIRALQLLRESGLDIPLLLVSGTVGEELAVLAVQHGATDYLLKDRLARLGLAVKGALEQKKEREQRRLAEAALYENERRFRSLIENSSDTIVLVSPDGKILYAAPSCVRVLGYQESELLGSDGLGLVHPEDRARVEKRLSALAQQYNARICEEYRVQHKDASWRWVEAVATNLIDEPSVRAIVVNYRDITPRKEAQASSRTNEERLRMALAASRMGVWEWNVQTNSVFWSPECFSILGQESYDGTLNAFTSIVHPEDLPGVMAANKQALAGEGEYKSEFRVITRDGNVRWVSNLGMAGYDETGKPLRMIGTVQDITERMIAEEERLTLIRAVEQSSNMVVITDVQGNIGYVNPKFSEVTGYSAAEVLGCNPRVLKSGETPPEQYRKLWETILSGKEWRGEFHNKRKDGELYWEYATISPIKNPQGVVTHFLAIKEDLSLRRSLEEQLRQSQKMEAVGRLAGGVAHDFNNLLTVIVGYSEMIESALQPGDALAADVREIKKAGERASSLVRQLLAFSRRQVLVPAILNLNRVIGDLGKMLRRLIGEDIELVTILSNDLGTVKADVGQIEQVIVNLAVNSRDAMPRGGKLIIETANVELDEAYAREHISVQPGPYVLLAISDTGLGMDSTVLPHIFEPFFTTKEQGKGTGLGLSTVYGIIKQSGGNIWVYSDPGRGTTFKIYLPRVEQPVTETKQPAVVETYRGTETILVVEDEDTVRKLAVETLVKQGYQLLQAKNPGEALTVCNDCRGPIHLLLSDIVMPGMSGRELAARLIPFLPALKVLYMSGYTDSAIILNGGLDPGTSFLQKPFTPHGLLQKVRQTLDSE